MVMDAWKKVEVVWKRVSEKKSIFAVLASTPTFFPSDPPKTTS
jgi:hypothetical protein